MVRQAHHQDLTPKNDYSNRALSQYCSAPNLLSLRDHIVRWGKRQQ